MLLGGVVLNVVFDLAGVVVRYDQAALIAQLFADPAVQATVRAEIVGHADWLSLDRGTLSQRDAIVRAAQRTGLSEADIAQFLHQMSTAWVVIPGTVELLYRVKTRGHTLFCLSDMHAASIAHLEQVHAFWEVFEGVVISCRVRLIKPEPSIYAYLMERYKLGAAETVFIDDTEANLEVAERFGIHTIRFENPAQCESRLKALGCI
jgi:putative hydrolase of the HAD superfamily